jgi:outer membrane receptor for ferrienterochelin and colicin
MFSEANKRNSLSTNAYIGGPIIKDKLYIFALAEGANNTSDTFANSQSTRTKTTTPNGMVKLDFLPNDQNRFELTAINNKKTFSITDYTNATPYSTSHDGEPKISQQTSGGEVTIAKWSSYLTDNLSVSALAGQVKTNNP